jgi:hypothetical protein
MPDGGYNPGLFKAVLPMKMRVMWGKSYSADVVIKARWKKMI